MEIINKVANSGLMSFDLEEYLHPGQRVLYDIKDNLFMGLMLKEKEFREFLKAHDWSAYHGKNVAIICSEEAVVPTWAYMLLVIALEPHVNMVVFGTLEDLEKKLYEQTFDRLDWQMFADRRVVVKGCSHAQIPVYVYAELTRRLKPIVKSLMFGEPCSTVPLYKQKNL
jgi:Protein of unknown function (DUF2480)